MTCRLRPRHGGLALVAAAAVASTSAPRSAAASPLFELVGGGQGSGGFNARVTGASAASTYFNPALLVDAEQGLELGVFVLTDQISISVDARSGSPQCPAGSCNIPEVLGTGPESFRRGDGSKLEQPAVPTAWLERGRPRNDLDDGLTARPRQGAGSGSHVRGYQMLGLVTPILGRRVVLGLHALIPLSDFTTARAFYNDEREQYFSNSLHPELYADRLTATSLAFGAGVCLGPKWSVGAAFTLSLENSAQAPVYVSNLSNLDTVLLDSDIGVRASVSPHLGVSWKPRKGLGLAATIHTEQAFRIQTGFTYFLSTGSEQGASVDFTHAYMPLQVAVGGTWETPKLGRHQPMLAANLVYGRWSQYEDRHSERAHPDYGWFDTLSGTLGLRDRIGKWTAMLDGNFQPTPVPDQTGRSNYVDNHRLGFLVGGEREVAIRGARFRFGAQFQLHRLLARHVTKFTTPDNPQPNPHQPGFGNNFYPQLVVDEVPDDAVDGQLGDAIPGRDGLQTNNPGFPGFGSEGWIIGGGFSVAVLY